MRKVSSARGGSLAPIIRGPTLEKPLVRVKPAVPIRATQGRAESYRSHQASGISNTRAVNPVLRNDGRR